MQACNCHLTSHTCVEDDTIVFKCRNCCNKELDAFFKLRVTVQPIHEFNNDDEFSRHGSCARINVSMDDDDIFFSCASKCLKDVSDVEVDIAPLTNASLAALMILLRAFNFKNIVVHWDLDLMRAALYLSCYFLPSKNILIFTF